MITAVSDARSNPNDQIAHAANVLRRSLALRTVFEAICKGGTKPKLVKQLMAATGFNHVKVLQLGGKLADNQLVHPSKIDGQTAYAKDRFLARHRAKIFRLAANPEKLRAHPTKYNPRTGGAAIQIRIPGPGVKVQITPITCDDIDQFSQVKKIKTAPPRAISEKAFKRGVTRLLGETGKFQDWGGEPNDLYTTKLRHKGKRRPVAFAFKGPGTQGILTPKKLGKNGNQIQRLFRSPAEMFIVQYHDQIDQDVIEQMEAFASLNSVREGTRIWYGVIDGDDTSRLLAAYPRQFGLK